MDSEVSSSSSADLLSWPSARSVAAPPSSLGSLRRWAIGLAATLVSFAALGTVAALWDNPFFVRMTPAGGWEVGLLALLSVLTGVYVAIRRTACGTRRAAAGGIVGFVGIACPVCNKVLLLLFGGDLLMTYFEPVRIYFAGGGSVLVLAAILAERGRVPARSAAARASGALRPNA